MDEVLEIALDGPLPSVQLSGDGADRGMKDGTPSDSVTH